MTVSNFERGQKTAGAGHAATGHTGRGHQLRSVGRDRRLGDLGQWAHQAAERLSHAGALTADLAKKFLASSRAQSEAFAKMVKDRVDTGAIKEEIYFDLLNEWAVEGISPEGPFVNAQRETVRRMVDLVLSTTPQVVLDS